MLVTKAKRPAGYLNWKFRTVALENCKIVIAIFSEHIFDRTTPGICF